jgi:predicted enzyme related to lactoylglutathione lyase
VEELEAAGVKVRVSNYVPGAGRQAFLRDPSGNRIELNQPDAL